MFFFPKPIRKFIKVLNIFLLLKKIHRNAPFGQRNLLKVGRNGIRPTLKLV
jgi:hypothetical protein